MTRKLIAAIFVSFVFSSFQAYGGGALSIRLVEASDESGGDDSALQDVIDVLKKSLVYKSYSLVAESSLSLPADNAQASLGEYVVQCSGRQKKLAISVMKDDEVLLNTELNLRDNKPFVVGGFPNEKGKLVLVFVAR